ncbi:MAG: ABC transporter permease [Chloroflexota bacterium]|nr:ABC transporter permease [Chloroflexota bacterium]
MTTPSTGATTPATPTAFAAVAVGPSRPRKARGGILRAAIRRWPLTIGLAIVLLLCLGALAAPLLSPYNPDIQSLTRRLQPPSGAHMFGTDEFGRDIFSRVLFGARITLLASTAAVLIAALVGCTVGLTAGYFGGWYDAIVGRLVDILFAFPVILLGIAIVAIMGPGVTSVIVAIAVASLPNFARVSRSAIVPEKEREYVLAARVVGASTGYLIGRTLLPNLIGPLMVLISLGFAYAVLYEASLSFLGLGAQPPMPEWGVMLSTARDFIFQAPWYAFFPGASIFILVFSLNLIGDGLRDAIDPHRRPV